MVNLTVCKMSLARKYSNIVSSDLCRALAVVSVAAGAQTHVEAFLETVPQNQESWQLCIAMSRPMTQPDLFHHRLTSKTV